jgi:hypothetical protein
MRSSRLRTTLAAVTAAAACTAVVVTAGPVATAAPGPAVPILEQPGGELLEEFTGRVAKPRPMRIPRIPRHPYMAPNGASNIHNDAYQTDAYGVSGPLGRDLQVTSTMFAAECASVTFDSRGRIVTVCVSPKGATLRILDPTTLEEIAAYELPDREPGTFSFDNFSGGGYFYLDHRDRAVVSTFDGHILVIRATSDSLELVKDHDVSRATGGSGIQSALPDWQGRIWFVTQSGVVGFVTRAGAVRSVDLPAAETIANSFAMDESGGVFIVSTHALYRFDAVEGRPRVTWRKRYDRGSVQKPGQVSQGSGTTPTLIGRADSRGGGSIAITDNADPRMNVLVFRRGKQGPGRAPLCKQPVFGAGRSADENSLISVPGGLIAENNHGYAGPLPSGAGTRSADTEPGVVRIDVDYRDGGCHVAWRNDRIRIPTLVSKVSLANGLLYTYTHPTAAELPWKAAALPDALAPEAWFLTAVDARTGKQVWSQLAGTGLGFNNNYAPVSLGPDGAAYVGTLGGLVRIADSR